MQMRQRELANTSMYLDAIAAAYRSKQAVETIAHERNLNPELAQAWAELVQLNPVPLAPSGHLTGQQSNVGGYASIRGWGEGLPTLLANQSDERACVFDASRPGARCHGSSDSRDRFGRVLEESDPRNGFDQGSGRGHGSMSVETARAGALT